MRKGLWAAAAAMTLLLAVPSGAAFQPRYSNINNIRATASATDSGDIEVNARLYACAPMELDIEATVEQNGHFIDSVSTHRSASNLASLNETISCASSGRFTVTFTFNAGGETETVTKTVRT